MSVLLRLSDASLAFGWRPLLHRVHAAIETGDRIALLGRNGEGKSTLLNVIRGAQTLDEGEIKSASGLRLAYLPQDPPAADARTVREVVQEALQPLLQLRERYQELLQNGGAATEIQSLEDALNQQDGWRLEQRIEEALQQFELNGDDLMADLSGGWRRRVWLARLGLSKPQLLLLDEPTNHLDVHAILWLERFLLSFQGAVLFVTHDRLFLQNVANRIWQLDRGELLDVRGDYQRFLRTRDEMLHAEALQQQRFDKKLAEEEIWIRQGIKARRTRNEGRVRALKALRAEKAAQIKRQAQVKLRLDTGERSGQQVIVAENVSFAYPGSASLIRDFSDIIERGERIGLLGANGVGKTTLLKLLQQEITPQSGRIEQGTQLNIAYFDQLRAQLNPRDTLRDSVSGGSDYVEIGGQRKHIASYLQDFLFPPERWHTPVEALSGGERARLLLARLFSQPANVLILDEPTNDLDLETLELLSEVLNDYRGTVFIVSHDRQFLEDVVTRLYVFNQRLNTIEHYVGGVNDWLQQGGDWADLQGAKRADLQGAKRADLQEAKEALPSAKKITPESEQAKTNAPKKLSYKYQRELEALPAQIEAAEAALTRLTQLIEQPDFYQNSHDIQQDYFQQLSTAQSALDALMARWLQLEAGDFE